MIGGRHFSARLAAAGLGWLVALSGTGCATHTDRLVPVMERTSAGDYSAAVDVLNDVIGVESTDELPRKWGADSALGILDRGVLLQALARFSDSARDLSAAEQELELIDITKDPVGTLAGYIYSDTKKPYKATPSERLTLNGVNLLNYVTGADMEGAAVEARRFQVARDYLDSESIDDGGVSAFGAYLAGFVFEHRGEGDRALRYYEDALELGPLPSLAAPAARLAKVNPFRGPRLQSLLAGKPKPRASSDGDLLVVLCLGRVAHKVPERMPVGAAIGLAGAAMTGDSDWLVRGATKFIVYPELVSTPSTLGSANVRIDGRDIQLEQLIDLDAAVRREYEEMKPKIIAAALTRLASRAAVAEGVRVAGQQDSNALGDVLAFVVEGALVGLDRPDTRSWTMMPARVLVARVPVSPGEHNVEVSFDGAYSTRTSSVSIAPGGYGAVVITEPR